MLNFDWPVVRVACSCLQPSKRALQSIPSWAISVRPLSATCQSHVSRPGYGAACDGAFAGDVAVIEEWTENGRPAFSTFTINSRFSWPIAPDHDVSPARFRRKRRT